MEPVTLLLLAGLAATVGMVSILKSRGVGMEEIAAAGRGHMNDQGQFGTLGITAAVVGVIALIVIVFLMAGVADPYFNATENITTAIQNASTGNSTVDALLAPFGLLVAAILVIGFVKQVTDRV